MTDYESLTEEQWLACKRPFKMIDFLEGKANDDSCREIVRFAYACCMRLKGYIPPKRRDCLRIIKRWINNKASIEEVETAVAKSLKGWEPPIERNLIVREMMADALCAFFMHKEDPFQLARTVAGSLQQATWHRRRNSRDNREARKQAVLLREMISYPR